MLLEIETVDPRIAGFFKQQRYRQLSDTLQATFAGFVMRDGDKESDMGDIYNVAGEGRADEKYFVQIVRSKDVVQAFVSEARKILNPLPDRGRMGAYQRDELKLPTKRETKRLEPSSPLYRALVAGVQAAHPSRTLDIK